MSLNVAVTGHRDKIGSVKEFQETLTKLKTISKDITILNGKARGFDTFIVDNFSIRYPFKYYYPNYDKYGRSAPKVRDRQMVDDCDVLVALWDGRETGGTFYTITYARRKAKPILYLTEIYNVPSFSINR